MRPKGLGCSPGSTRTNGPLLRFQGSGGDSGGFNLRGTSSSGKTTALRAAASVYGGTGYVRQWRATANGLEAIAEAHNDCLLILDELAQIDASEAGECAYLLGNGAGKSRMTKSLSAKPPKEWRLLFLSAGELSLSEHMLEAGKRARAGQGLRLADLPADAGAGMGIIETLHGHANSGAIVNHIRDATAHHYGHAGTAWLDWLVQQDGLSARVDGLLKQWASEAASLCPSDKAARVLSRFGLVAAAGELATEAGITGWAPGEARRACLDCARAWWGAQEWLIQRDEDRILDHVRAIIEQHSARFSDWHADESQNRIPNRLGFRRQISGGQFELDRFEWLVFRSAWRSDICRGLDPSHVERVLIAAGCLIPDRHAKPTQAIRSPIGVQRFYVLSASLFDGEVSTPYGLAG